MVLTPPRLATAQVILAALPMPLACLTTSGSVFYVCMAFIALQFVVAVSLCRLLYRQSRALVVRDEENGAIIKQLEIASQDLEVMNEHLETLTITDALTGVANRRAFDLTLAREWRRSAREQVPLAMLLTDIDHFKQYNGLYGHQGGDQCLQEVAAVLRSVFGRPADMLARYGGEEFAVILPATDLDGAALLAERALAALAEHELRHEASPFGVVTVSIGAASMMGDREEPAQNLTARADAALYAAKRGGRNRVHVARAEWESGAALAGSPR